MISVVIPLYNCKQYIVRAIQSVLSQTFLPAEIIVVNDGSSDNGERLVEEMNHPLIKLINQKNGGVSVARNTGIKEAKHKYIAFLDADDEWLPNHLETIMQLIKKYPNCHLFSTSYIIAYPNKKTVTPQFGERIFSEKDGILDNYFELSSGSFFPINMNSFAVAKEKIESINCFPVGVPSGEDIITIARLYSFCDFAYSKETTSIYHIIHEGKSSRPIKREDPLNLLFDELLNTASHRKGIRQFVSSWYKRRMVGAILFSKDYKLALREFLIAFRIYPFQRKLYTSLIISCISAITKKKIYEINLPFKKAK